MRLSLPVVLCVAALPLAFLQPLHAQSSDQVRKIIQADYNQIDSDEMRGDAFAGLKYRADGCIEYDRQGHPVKTDLAKLKLQINSETPDQKELLRNVKVTNAQTTIESFSLKGTTANVLIQSYRKVTVYIPSLKRTITNSGSKDGNNISQDIWRLTGNTWLMISHKSITR